jgi:PIN domain nuclease of toxin-antitoxin system
MPSLVADTHAAVWYLLQSPRLSPLARERMAATIAGGDPIFVPSICLVEIIYLVEKKRIPQADWTQLQAALDSADAAYRVVPLDDAVARAVSDVPRDTVPDMPDRIIAATALHMGLPLVSRDGRIRMTGIEVIW